MITESLTLLTTKDHEQVAIWQVVEKGQEHQTNQQNVLLTHGTFSDKRIVLGIARYLAVQGYHCYILEWRGHGTSPAAKHKFDMETVALYDVAATFDYLLHELTLPSLHCITHSGGATCLTMFLIKNQTYINKVNSLTIFAAQAFAAALTPTSYAKVLMTKTMTRALGYIPAKIFNLGAVNESYVMMKPWFDWNLGQHLRSNQKAANKVPFDYRQHMPKITVPVYAIAAKGDDFIAPTIGCRLFLEAFENPDNQFREFAVSHGDLEDYTHSRILMSKHAAKEIWPTVLAWLEQHAI